MVKVVVVGGGFSGCGAAIAAVKAGAEVTLLEKNDTLLGAGNRAGRFRKNGEIVVVEELKELGGGEIIKALESIKLHEAGIIEEEHTFIYHVGKAEPTVRKTVEHAGVKIRPYSRVANIVKRKEDTVEAVKLANGEVIRGDAFVDAVGGSGGYGLCVKYGGGCVMCRCFKCPAFGDRVSIATKAGAMELVARRPNGLPGKIGAGMKLYKDTLAPELLDELEEKGVVTVPLPKEYIDPNKLKLIGAVRSKKQNENINLVDIGPVAKCVGLAFFSLQWLRKIKGFENAMIEDPLGSFRGQKVGAISMTPRENTLKVEGLSNIFVAGERSGPNGGVVTAISTGFLAGHNATRQGAGKKLLKLPPSLVLGDFIAHIREQMQTQEGLDHGHSPEGGTYLERMIKLGFYPLDPDRAHGNVEAAGLSGIFNEPQT